MLIVVGIAAYNEEKNIERIIKESSKFCDRVVVCDDGSLDLTSEKAQNAGAVVIKHEINKGKGAALGTLFQYCKEGDADILVTIDGDGQFLPEEIPKLIKPVKENGCDLVIGNRYSNSQEMPKYRKIGNKFFDKLTKMASKLEIEDTQSGFRSYSKKAIENIEFTTHGFGAESEIIINAINKKLKISEEDIKVIYKTGSKTSTKNPISHSVGLLGTIIEIIAIQHPLKYLGIPGFVLIIIGIAFTIVVILYFNDTREFSIPSTLIALGGLTIGTILLLMSVVLFSISRMAKREFNTLK